MIIPKLLVDTGSEFTGAPERMLERIGIRREKKDVRFILANGQEVGVALALRLSASTSISRSMRLFSPNPAISLS
jgi:Aspartyl protease